MFRTRIHLSIFRNLLRHTNIASRCPSAYYKVQVRDPCPTKPPPPPPKPKDDSAFWGAMTVAFIAAGFAFVAKQNPEIRDWLTIYAPWFDDLIAIIFEENMTYGEFSNKCVQDAKRYISDLVKNDKPKPCALDAADKAKISVPQPPVIEKEYESIDPDNPPCEEPPPVVVTKSACEIVELLKDRGNDVLSNYYTAITACSLYNQTVLETMANFSFPTLKELHDHMAERLNLVKTSIKNAEESFIHIDELTHYLECGAKGTKEDIEKARTLFKDYHQQIKASKIQFEWENDKSIALDSQWQKVEFLVDKYADENETMFSDIKYDQNKLTYNGDIDLQLYHTYRYSNQLKTDLKDLVFGMTDRVNRAFDTLPQGDKEKKQRDYMIQSALKLKRAEMDKEYRKRYDDQRVANDKKLKEALKQQLERNKETVEKRLIEVEREATIKLNKLVSEKVAFEKTLFAQQLKEMSTKLTLVEDKLNARLKAESETRRSQELWAAGACLLAATHCGENIVSVERELKAIEKASGEGDKLVTTVLKAIPASVREIGLVPESVLLAKYHEVEKTALKVALVEQDGGPLPVYFLSWLMSMLLFLKISGIPQEEVDNPPKEPFEDMDTFDLLRRARFWLERGNLSAAVRYVSSLQGASLGAMLSWRDSAHAHLETRQAAEAILAHAAALALQYI